MPIERVRGPDGKIHRFRVPEGTTPDEVMAMARQQFAAEQQVSPDRSPVLEELPERPEESGWEDFGEGLVASGMGTYYGLKDLVTDLDDEDRATLQDWEEDAAQSGWGSAGKFTGELAQLAIPGGIGLKGARLLSAAGKAPRLAKALPLASDVAGTAAHSYAQLPEERGTTRGEEAVKGGAFALAGGGLTRALAPLVRGVRGTEATERLRDLGADLTPGQMKGGTLQGIENFGEYLLPSVSKSIQKLKAKSAESVQRLVLGEAAPPTLKTLMKKKAKDVVKFEPTAGGWKGMEELQNAYTKGYEKAWGKSANIDVDTLPKMLQSLSKGSHRLSNKEIKNLNSVLDEVVDKIAKNPKGSPSILDEVLRNALKNPNKKRNYNAVLADMRGVLREGLPEANKRAVGRMDKGWPKLKTIQLANKRQKASLGRGKFDQQGIAAGSARTSPLSKTSIGEGHLQRTAADWDELVGKPAGMLMSASRRLVQGFPEVIPFPVKSTSRLVAGRYGWQERMRERLQRRMAERLRYTSSGARLGGAYEGD